jgi:hypothetical protein
MTILCRHFVGAIIGCVLLVGCSSTKVSNKARLTSDAGPSSGYAMSPSFAGPSGGSATAGYSRYGGGGSGAFTVPRFPQLWPKRPTLRRYAAMPRHKPHAPYVRQNENACLGSGLVHPTRFVQPIGSIGRGQCYIARPFEMHAAAQGAIRFEPAAKLRCQMVPSVKTWVAEVLRPAARRYLGSEVVKLSIAGSYGCRMRNHKVGAKLSEHGRANALDISKFHLANGQVVTVKRGWRGPESHRRFLRYVRRGACEHFSTVLSPDADRYHHDHFHFDLASHGRRGTYRVCK